MTLEFANDGQPLTPERLAEVAGENLPEDYRAFMLERNGGSLTETVHLPDDDSGASVRAFLSVNDGRDPHGLEGHIVSYRDRHPHGFLPIAVDSSSNLILLDVGYEEYGSVWFWDHEGEADEGEPPRTDNITKIADTFAKFLDRLTSDLTAEQEEYIRAAAAEAISMPGTYKVNEPFTFRGRQR